MSNTARALNLVAANTGKMTSKGHKILNAGIADCLRLGWVEYAPNKAVGYRLTPLGQATISSMRTGIPLKENGNV